MPLYEYQCQECKEKLEAIQKLADDPYTICPHCGGALRKLISSPAIQFKGSGFYITDYAKSGSKGETSKSESTKSESSSSSDSSSSSTAPTTASSDK